MCRKIGENSEERRLDRKSSASFLFKGEYFQPLGFLEKNWMVSQRLTRALSITFENPPAMETWNPNRIKPLE